MVQGILRETNTRRGDTAAVTGSQNNIEMPDKTTDAGGRYSLGCMWCGSRVSKIVHKQGHAPVGKVSV